MRVMGVETSGRTGTLALLQDGQLLAERTLEETGRRHAQSLVAEVMELLASVSWQPRDVETVGVSIGPGSFTGLRVGVVFAKTWAYAAGARLVAVETLQAIAENSPAEVGSVWVLSDAQRGDVYAARYQRTEATAPFERLGEILITPAQTWLADRARGEVLSGPGAQALWTDASPLRFLPAELQTPRASVVASIAARLAAAGDLSDPWSLEPFYLRRAAAEETWDAAGRP